MNDEGFRVDSAEKAAIVMRKYRRLAQKLQQNEGLAKSEHDRIDRWLENTNAPIEGQMDFLYGHLEAWAMSQRAEGHKSVSLPDGSIKTRKQDNRYEIDKSTFLAWAQEAKREDLMRVSYAPNMTAIKDAVIVDGGKAIDPASGEVIPGVSPLPDHVSVTVHPDLEAVDLDGIDEGELDDVE